MTGNKKSQRKFSNLSIQDISSNNTELLVYKHQAEKQIYVNWKDCFHSQSEYLSAIWKIQKDILLHGYLQQFRNCIIPLISRNRSFQPLPALTSQL